MQDENRIAPVRRQGAVGFVGDGHRPEPCIALQFHLGWRFGKGETFFFNKADRNQVLVMLCVFAHRKPI